MLQGLNHMPSFNGKITIKENGKTVEEKETTSHTDNRFITDLAKQFANRMQKVEVHKDPRNERFNNQLSASIKGIKVEVDGYKEFNLKEDNIKRLDITIKEDNCVVNWKMNPDELQDEPLRNLVYKLNSRIRESAPSVNVVERFFNKLYGG